MIRYLTRLLALCVACSLPLAAGASDWQYSGAERIVAAHCHGKPGIDAALRRRYREILERCDFARFVRSPDEPHERRELLDGAIDLIERMEKSR